MFFFRRKPHKKTAKRFNAIPILTKKEEEFFIRLCKVLPTCYVFPKVAISALLEPKGIDGIFNKADLDIISHKTVDYAIYDADLKPLCVVNLAHGTYSSDAEGVSDNYFKGAGIKIIRSGSKRGLTAEQISKTILPLLRSVTPRVDAETYLGAVTVPMIYQADLAPSNIRGLSTTSLDQLTPHKALQNSYPHIWQRICMFAPDPRHLQRYLDTLTIQDHAEKRAGFPIEAWKEIADIKSENGRFLQNSGTGWHTGFVNL